MIIELLSTNNAKLAGLTAEEDLREPLLLSVKKRLPWLLAMVVSSLVGTLIPIFFKRIKIDPAVASGPLITTVNDLVAVVTYYGMSWVLLINVFHFAG